MLLIPIEKKKYIYIARESNNLRTYPIIRPPFTKCMAQKKQILQCHYAINKPKAILT